MKSLKKKNYKTKQTKKLKYKKLSGGNNITFEFIDSNDYADEEESHLEKIDVSLRNTKTNDNDNTFFKKNALRIMDKPHHVLYMLYEGEIIGIIVGKTTDDNYINISEVEIRPKYLTKEYKDIGIGISGRRLLTEYINKVISKYPNIIGFKLFNGGGKKSCFLYYKVFTELGYKIIPDDIDCSKNDYIPMKFESPTSKSPKSKSPRSKSPRSKSPRGKKQGGKYKEMMCSQAIVSAARVKCWKKCKTKKYMADEKALLKMNKQYDAFLAKTCKDDDYECIQKNRKGNPLFDQIIQLEAKSGKMSDACMSKHCTKEELGRLNVCIDLGEEQCRAKYADLIKKSKKKILPLADCTRNL